MYSTLFSGIDSRWIKLLTEPGIAKHLGPAIDALRAMPPDRVSPQLSDVFNFARITPYGGVRVVIIGQDPYPDRKHAHGLAFSSRAATVPASLRNIFAALAKSGLLGYDAVAAPRASMTPADLTVWAEQGVLLLNTALTTEAGRPGAHATMWGAFTRALIAKISETADICPCPSLIFMLWGGAAAAFEPIIDPDCVIMKWRHPSPLAQAAAAPAEKFAECTHFADANDVLVRDAMNVAIDWNPAARHVVFTDGACVGNGTGLSSAGYGVYFDGGPLRGTVLWGRVPVASIGGGMIRGSSIRAEGAAIIAALEAVLDSPLRRAELYTDSMFWIRMIDTHMPRWSAAKHDEMKNPDQTRRIRGLCESFAPGRLVVVHVPSHGKNPDTPPMLVIGNEIADSMAQIGRLAADDTPKTARYTFLKNVEARSFRIVEAADFAKKKE